MYIYLLIRYHCNGALLVLHFVNFDNFLTFPNRKILHAKHNSGWNFKRFQTHVTQTVSVTSKTVQTNANTLSNVSTLRCQSGRRRWKPAGVLELKNVMQFCWRRNIDCFRTPMHTFCFSSPLDTNHMKQSQLEVNILWAAEFTGKKK